MTSPSPSPSPAGEAQPPGRRAGLLSPLARLGPCSSGDAAILGPPIPTLVSSGAPGRRSAQLSPPRVSGHMGTWTHRSCQASCWKGGADVVSQGQPGASLRRRGPQVSPSPRGPVAPGGRAPLGGVTPAPGSSPHGTSDAHSGPLPLEPCPRANLSSFLSVPTPVLVRVLLPPPSPLLLLSQPTPGTETRLQTQRGRRSLWLPGVVFQATAVR